MILNIGENAEQWELIFFLVGVCICMTTLQNSLSLLNKNEDINTQLTNKIKYAYVEKIHVLYTRIYTQNMHLGSNLILFLIVEVDK